MKILFIAPRMPLPADTGGKIRTFNILKQMVKMCEVDLVCFSFEHDDREHAKTLESYGIKVHLVKIKEPGILEKILQVFFGRQPYSISKYYTKEMEERLALLNEANDYDAVHFDHLHMAPYRDLFEQKPVFLDEHNVEYKILERCVEVEKSAFKKWLFQSQSKKMKAFEAKAVSGFTACSVVSEDDQGILSALVDNSCAVYVLPNGVDTQYFQRSENGKKGGHKSRSGKLPGFYRINGLAAE